MRLWTVLLGALTLGLLDVGGLSQRAAEAQYASPGKQQSWGESISSGFKQGIDKLASPFTAKKTAAVPGPEDDAVALRSKAKPGVELFVAMARLYEQSGRLAEAGQQYQMALKDKPDHLPALLGYAQLKDHLGKQDEALQLYQRAAKTHPREASVQNNMGLCCARMGRLDDAAAALSQAVQLDPKNPLYRNNVAAVLVDQGRLREAFEQLRQVHGDAAAYYNVGYLLNKKGQSQAALQHFSQALRADPSLEPAQRWVEYLQKSTAQARLPKPVDAGLKISDPRATPQISSPPDTPRELAPMPPEPLRSEIPLPKRLPPTSAREPAPEGPTLPGVSRSRNSAPLAPLPPVTASRPDIAPLPRVQ